MIEADARNLAFASGLELVEDEGLLEEVSGLVEWPVVLMGSFEEEFSKSPPKSSASPSGRTRNASSCGLPPRRVSPTASSSPPISRPPTAARRSRGAMARWCVPVFPMRATSGRPTRATCRPRHARRGRPRLGAQARRRRQASAARPAHGAARPPRRDLPCQARNAGRARVRRIARLAEDLAPVVGADPALARRAALLAKADLQSEIVGEFPELQGQMGRIYAGLQGEDPAVAAAIEDHYRPQGPSDRVPSDPVSIAVALADKLDTLVGFWAIDEKPTGSKDPYALRAPALGVIRSWSRMAAVELYQCFSRSRRRTSTPARRFPRQECLGRRPVSWPAGPSLLSRPPFLLPRPSEGLSPRQRCAARPHRRVLAAALQPPRPCGEVAPKARVGVCQPPRDRPPPRRCAPTLPRWGRVKGLRLRP